MSREVKNSKVSTVRIGYDGRVHKWYRGPLARERYENEKQVLNFLEERGCPFVPRVLEEHPDELYLVTTNCGTLVTQLGDEKMKAVFDELTAYGVEHDDKAARNITYNPQLKRFCVIDFEFATIISTGRGLSVDDAEEAKQDFLSFDHRDESHA